MKSVLVAMAVVRSIFNQQVFISIRYYRTPIRMGAKKNMITTSLICTDINIQPQDLELVSIYITVHNVALNNLFFNSGTASATLHKTLQKIIAFPC